MFALTKVFATIYAAALLMQLGSSLLMTYLALRLDAAGIAEFWGGALMAANALGMVLGGRVGYWLIGRVSHVRAFVVSAGVIVTAVLSHQLSEWLTLWLVLRFVVGVAMMCQLMVIESWLNDCAPGERRGGAMSLYMVASYVGMMLGQLLLGFGNGLDALVLSGVAIAFAIGLMPMALHRGVQPSPVSQVRVSFMQYVRRLPQSLGTILASGVLNGCFYGLTPIFAAQSGFNPAQVGQFMALTIAAGLLAQLPLGRLSDRFSRVSLIRLTAIALCVAYLPLAFLQAPAPGWVMLTGAVIGFLQFCLYPLGVVHANDNLEPELRVSVAGVLLVTFGIGATIGPLLAGALMEHWGRQALYLFGIGVAALVVCLVSDSKRVPAAVVQVP
ncbi:MFS transporter [Pseudomonas vancouverensis]|uniref:MFS transporter n=1 Tax=Pseudomonas vancouverensis TaxID=95300 RepID=A0A1H2NML8_PSEVA|nr:MFS transporter [Pseudomonas vancouverensis]KAB0495301.1 MFS transporter [Pseudomonas vancouverensis]TDB56938.1 MFS transporter [Pseudomonas vancouverensis]SDV06624.1 Predicted arabinose efflux permease, MFS family [Pseudomonas vancouverensis]